MPPVARGADWPIDTCPYTGVSVHDADDDRGRPPSADSTSRWILSAVAVRSVPISRRWAAFTDEILSQQI